jgi:hypothetical protein
MTIDQQTFDRFQDFRVLWDHQSRALCCSVLEMETCYAQCRLWSREARHGCAVFLGIAALRAAA